MKAIHCITVAATLAFGMTAAALAAEGDPEVIIYRFPGVLDDNGVATAFHCTNFSGVSETIRFVTRNAIGTLLQNNTLSINHLETRTASTRSTVAYNETSLATGAVAQGTMAIAATSTNIICTAMTIDASTVVPVGVALRGIRFSPVPGSQE